MRDDYVCVNDSVVKRREARIPAMDRGFLFGDGFFETTRIVGGTPFRLARHLERMSAACHETGWEWVPQPGRLGESVQRLIRRNEVEEGYLRISVSRGLHDGPLTELRATDPTVLIDAHPMDLAPLDSASPITLARAPWRRNESSPVSSMKSLSYQDSLLALARGRGRGAEEVYFLNGRDEVAEGSISNIFFVSDGTVLTPQPDCGLLPGIGREAVLEICHSQDIPHRSGRYAESELLEAEEIFCTNSLRGVMPVERVIEEGGRTLGERPLTARLQRLFAALVRDECAGEPERSSG